MRRRQVHLDFHTSEAIEGIGSQFSKENFQAMLKKGHVDSITVFSKCRCRILHLMYAAIPIPPLWRFQVQVRKHCNILWDILTSELR